MSHKLQQMQVDSIVPSKDNARTIDQKSQGFQELVESIESGGVQIPIHVWPHPKRKDKYEIRCGERRWRACKNLGHKTIPAIVHRGISYEVAMLLTITENKFHEELTPLEEVEEIARCMDHLGSDAKLISGLIGQTEQWVRLRSNIHKNLGQGWRQIFTGPDHLDLFQNWSIAHMALIARLPAVSQVNLLKEIRSFPWKWRQVSVVDLDRRLGEALNLLTKAKWNLDDDTLLPKAGACSQCTKRSGSQPVLWFGAVSDQVLSKDRCLDPQCWKNKTRIHLQRRAKLAGEKYSNLVYISAEHLSEIDKEELSKTYGRVLDPGDVQKSAKGAKDSIPAMVVYGKGAGTITFIKEKQFARPGDSAPRRAGKPTPLKQRREMLKAKRWSQVFIELRKKVDSAGAEQIVYKETIDTTTCIMAIAAVYGNVALWALETPSRGRQLVATDKQCQKRIDEVVKNKGKYGLEKALEYLWTSVKPSLKNLVSYSGPASQTSRTCVDNARWVARLIQVDIDKMFQEVSKQKGFTVPKSWKLLNADGTAKTASKNKSGKRGMIKKT